MLFDAKPGAVERVAKGMKLLDEQKPGWEDSIHNEHLEMSSPWKCVLGQVFGSYLDGLDALELQSQPASIYHGFNKVENETWGYLQSVWLIQIHRRHHHSSPEAYPIGSLEVG